jgi:hypothetical protein
MDSERWLPIGLAKEAADEIERLRRLLQTIDDINCSNSERYNDLIDVEASKTLNPTGRRG